MTVQLMILILALVAVIILFKNFNACIYFIVIVDILLRIFTYLKTYILKDDAFDFLSLIPTNVPAILQSFDLGMFNDIVMFLYVVIYIIFEVLIIKTFINKKF